MIVGCDDGDANADGQEELLEEELSLGVIVLHRL